MYVGRLVKKISKCRKKYLYFAFGLGFGIHTIFIFIDRIYLMRLSHLLEKTFYTFFCFATANNIRLFLLGVKYM